MALVVELVVLDKAVVVVDDVHQVWAHGGEAATQKLRLANALPRRAFIPRLGGGSREPSG